MRNLSNRITFFPVYVTVDRNEVLKMIVYTSGRKSDLRKWNTKITQINCGSLEMGRESSNHVPIMYHQQQIECYPTPTPPPPRFQIVRKTAVNYSTV